MTMETEPTVFVVDDDPAIQDSLAVLMQTLHLPAEFYSSAREFLDVYDPSRPGCLLLDIRMPGSGFSLLKELSARESPLPVIVITGHGQNETRDKAIKLGAVAYFEKPFDVPELCECIRQMIDSSSEAT